MKPEEAFPPLPGANLEGWGFLQINQERVPHTGVDYNVNHGSPADDLGLPVVVPWEGAVVAAIPKLLYSWGRLVVTRHVLPYDVDQLGKIVPKGTVVYCRFAHLASFSAFKGQVLRAGQQIGTCGGSNGVMPGNWRGDATDPNGQWSPHLHFDIRIGGRGGLVLWDGGNEDAVQDWPSVRRYGYPAPGDVSMLATVAGRYLNPNTAIPGAKLRGGYVARAIFDR